MERHFLNFNPSKYIPKSVKPCRFKNPRTFVSGITIAIKIVYTGSLAEQVVNFTSEYETFSLEHVVNDRSAYLYGISLVFDEIENLSKFTLGLETILAQKISILS